MDENYTMIKKWLLFLDSHVEDDVMKCFGSQLDFLRVWLWPNATDEGMNNDKDETLCLNNLYRVFNLRTALKIAYVIGVHIQADIWISQASRSSEVINNKLFNKKSYTYSDGSMANLAVALLAEVVPAQDSVKVLESLEREILVKFKGYIHAGITGGALLFRLLRGARPGIT